MATGRSAPRLAEAAAQLEAVRDVLRAISRSPFDLDALLQRVCDHAVRLCHADFGYIFVPEAGVYRLAASSGAPLEQVEWTRRNPIRVDRSTTVGRVAMSGTETQIADVLRDPEWDFRKARSLGPYRSVLSVPIQKEGEIIGIFSLARVEPGNYPAAEVDLVRTFADQAAIVIDSVRLLRTIEQQREELARYLPPPVAELVSSADGAGLLAGHRREVSAVYCDLRGFTAFAETADPEEVFAVLGDYQREIGQTVLAHRGTIAHYAGDGIMSFLNDPIEVPEHPVEAVRMALEMRDGFSRLAADWARSGYELGLGIGISVGYGTVGRVGFEGYFGYAVVGSVANMAARLCAVAEPGQIVISQRAHARVESGVSARPLGSLQLKGFSRPVEAFAVEGLRTVP